MKKNLLRVGKALLICLLSAVFLFSAGTVFPQIPLIGSVANILTVGSLHLWLPLCAALFLASLVLLAGKKSRFSVFALVCSFLSLLCTLVFLFGNASCVREFGVKPNVFLRKEDVSSVKVETCAYTESGQYRERMLNIYRTEDSAPGSPVMIYIHGGGWIQGSREDHIYYSKVFANHGYVVFSVDYDLSSEDRHLAESTELQIAEAFGWIKNHAADYGADISRLYVTGGSAGGNLALELAYKINGGVYRTSEDGTELPPVTAVSVTFPVASPASFFRNTDPVLGGTAHRMASAYTGCSPEENPALFESLEPVRFLTENTPATCIMVGASDSLVPPVPSYELTEALQNTGIAHRTVVVPYANHIFDRVDGGMLCNAYLDLSLRWFESFS